MIPEYKMLVGKETLEFFDAVLKAQYQPSKENTERLERLQRETDDRLIKSQKEKEIAFIDKYGQQLYDFVAKLSEPNFLVGKDINNSLFWEVKWDSDNDDYWDVYFYK